MIKPIKCEVSDEPQHPASQHHIFPSVIITFSGRNELRHEKTYFFICENKGTDQLHGYHAADQRLCFCYIDATITLLSNIRIHVFSQRC